MKKLVLPTLFILLLTTCNKEIFPPEVKTISVYNIDVPYAYAKAEIIDDGGDDISVRGVCWSKEENPDLQDQNVKLGYGTGEFSAKMSGLVIGQKYYVRAYAINNAGTSYGEQLEFIATSKSNIPIIPHNNTNLYVHPVDNHKSIIWGGYGTPIGATSKTNGLDNTLKIVAELGNKTSAAKICNDLEAHGYDDWYLPAFEELKSVYKFRDSIGNLDEEVSYWSSTEYNDVDAIHLSFINGKGGHTVKRYEFYLRCVRKD